MADGKVTITVVLALRQAQPAVTLSLPSGATAWQAVTESGLLSACRDDPERLALGIHGQLVGRDHVLSSGDRIEILRPLLHEPRARRRTLARQGRSMGSGRSRR